MTRLSRIFAFLLLVLAPRAPYAEDATGDQILASARAIYSKEGPNQALPEYHKALAVYQQEGNKLGEAITLGLMGNCYKRLGNYPKALELLNTALGMKRSLHARLEEGKTLSNLGLVYWEQAEYPKAIDTFNQSIQIAHEIGNVQLEASASNNLGLVFDEEGDYHRSLEQYKKALDLQSSINYDPGVSDALGNIGGVYLSLGHFSDAENYYRQALEISRRLESKPSETQDIGNIALCLEGQGKYSQAIDELDEAIQLAESAGIVKEGADWHKARATALLRIGRFDEALKDYTSAEEVYEKAGLRRELSETLAETGDSYLSVGDVLSAEKRIGRAIQVAKQIGYERGVILDELSLADVLMRTGELRLSRKVAMSALHEASRINQIDATVQGLLQLAEISRKQGILRDASKFAEGAETAANKEGLRILGAQSLDLSAQLLMVTEHPSDALLKLNEARDVANAAGDVGLQWQIEFHRGEDLEKLDKQDEAVEAYKASIAIVEDVRSGIAERRFRTGYFQDKQKVYLALISLLLRMGKKGDAFDTSERLREFSFLQFRGQVPGKEDSRVIELKSAIRHLQDCLDQEESKSPEDRRDEAVSVYSKELIADQQDLQALLESQSVPATVMNTKDSARRIRAAIPEHAALLEYVVEDTELVVFVLTRNGLQTNRTHVSAKDLTARIDLFRDLLSDQRSSAWEKPAASLRRLVISPLENEGLLTGIRSLLIVPHGALNNLPFAALISESGSRPRFLVEQYDLAQLPSGNWLLNPSRHESDDPARVLAVAPSNAKLKYAISEAKHVATLFAPTSTMLLGVRATETRFKETAGQYDLIHLATHGFFNPINPLFSGLVLEKDDQNDGRLEVHEIMALHLKARLVTLSACDTALGGSEFSDMPAGDEFVGLSRAFLEAGSDAVMASLWKVDDRSTALMMGRVYREMQHHQGQDALALAQRSMITDTKFGHPFFWAPFVFTGGEETRNTFLAEKR